MGKRVAFTQLAIVLLDINNFVVSVLDKRCLFIFLVIIIQTSCFPRKRLERQLGFYDVLFIAIQNVLIVIISIMRSNYLFSLM